MNTIEDYKVKGREIIEKHCTFKDNAIMLPPAPKQTYIDVYRDEEVGSSSPFEGEKRLQVNYEAEVRVYRVLEELPEGTTVLHGFEYTHHQYRLCDKTHDRKSCSKCKGKASDKSECDFVVVGKNFVVIIEVKNIPQTSGGVPEEKRKELQGTLQKSLKQRERTECLVKGLVDQVFDGVSKEQCKILSFSAFPSTNRGKFQDLDKAQKTQILCEEDLLDFNRWWIENVTSIVPSDATEDALSKHEVVKEVLVAMWCTDINQCEGRNCSLQKCIMDIDEELRKGRITFLSKKRLPNPNVMKAADIEDANIDQDTNIFRDILGVENLTVEQCDAFNTDQNLMVLNGPAGSGKTIILLAKIIKLIRSNPQNKVVLFYFSLSGKHHQLLQDIFQKADISNDVLEVKERSLDSAEMTVQKLINSREKNQVVLVKMELIYYNPDFEAALDCLIGTDTHVFIDDCQANLYLNDMAAGFIADSCTKIAMTNLAWIACDLTQRTHLCHLKVGNKAVHKFIQDMPSENIITLSMNLRNTSDIAAILSKLRDQLLLSVPGTENDKDDVLPIVKPGHFIHGPRTIIHIVEKKIEKNDFSLIENILDMELDKLCISGLSSGFKIGIIVDTYYDSLGKTILNIMERRSDKTIELCEVTSCYSVEYPAVIVVHDLDDKEGIFSLYLKMSRARVYCAVTLFPVR